MKPLLIAALAVAFAAPVSSSALAQKGPRIDVPHVVVDVATGEIVSEAKGAHPWYPASLTKMMTAWTVFKAIDRGEVDEKTPVKMTLNAALQSPSKMGYRPGTLIPMRDALAMLIVKSANDVSMAIAETVGGSPEGFAAMMNREAAKLGMTSSYFANPHGLPHDRQISSARDMALLASRIKRDYPRYDWLFDTPAITNGKRTWQSFNTLMERYRGANGMKTGFVCGSGYNLAASAVRTDASGRKRELVAVVMGRSNGRARARDAAQLLTLSFEGRDTSDATLSDLVPDATTPTEPFDMRPYACDKRPVQPVYAPTPEAVVDPAPEEPVKVETSEGVTDAVPAVPVARTWLDERVTTRIPYRIGELGYTDPWYDLAELERIGMPDLKPPLPTIDGAPLIAIVGVPTPRPPLNGAG